MFECHLPNPPIRFDRHRCCHPHRARQRPDYSRSPPKRRRWLSPDADPPCCLASAAPCRGRSSRARTPPSPAHRSRAWRCCRSRRRTPCAACPRSALAGSVAPIRSRHFLIAPRAFEAHHHARPRRHEVGQAAEERPLAVDVVEALGLGLGHVDHPHGADRESGGFDTGEDRPVT